MILHFVEAIGIMRAIKQKRGDIYKPKEYTPEMEEALEEYRIVCIKKQKQIEQDFFEKLQKDFTEEITSILKEIRNSNDEDALKILSKFSSKERMRGRTHYGNIIKK